VDIKPQTSNASFNSRKLELETLKLELTRAEKYEKLAFTFCKLGTAGLLCWLLTPPIFVLLVALAAIGLYGKALTLGLTRSRCMLRRPLLIMGFWAAVVAADLTWLILK